MSNCFATTFSLVYPIIPCHPLPACLLQWPLSKGGERIPTALTPPCSSGSPSTRTYSPLHQIPSTSRTCALCFRRAISWMRPVPHTYVQILARFICSSGVHGSLHHPSHVDGWDFQFCHSVLCSLAWRHAEQWLTVIVMNRWLLIYGNLVHLFHLETSLGNLPLGEFNLFSNR